MIVVDASVWLSFLVRRDVHHAGSRSLLVPAIAEGRPLVAPLLLLAEVGGAIARVRGRPDLGAAAIDRLLSLPNLRLVPIDPELGLQAARLAAEYRLRGADACYVAVAVALDISLISWDNEQLERAGPVVRTLRPDEMAG